MKTFSTALASIGLLEIMVIGSAADALALPVLFAGLALSISVLAVGGIIWNTCA